MSELTDAKAALGVRQAGVSEQLRADIDAARHITDTDEWGIRFTRPAEPGERPSQDEAWSLGDAYNRLLTGMELDGEELVEHAERQADDVLAQVQALRFADLAGLREQLGPLFSERTLLRDTWLAGAATMAMLFYRRQLHD